MGVLLDLPDEALEIIFEGLEVGIDPWNCKNLRDKNTWSALMQTNRRLDDVVSRVLMKEIELDIVTASGEEAEVVCGNAEEDNDDEKRAEHQADESANDEQWKDIDDIGEKDERDKGENDSDDDELVEVQNQSLPFQFTIEHWTKWLTATLMSSLLTTRTFRAGRQI